MGRRRRRRSTPLGRLLRGRRLDRNPLRRRSDRAETVVLGLLLAAFLAAAPFAVHAAGAWAHVRAAREQHAQQARLDQVQAVVLHGASRLDGPSDVSARWRAPAGPVRTGVVLVPPGAEAGTTVPVWINRVGQQEGPPLLGSQVTSRVPHRSGVLVARTGCRWLMCTGSSWAAGAGRTRCGRHPKRLPPAQELAGTGPRQGSRWAPTR
jgi:hypothetical protein